MLGYAHRVSLFNMLSVFLNPVRLLRYQTNEQTDQQKEAAIKVRDMRRYCSHTRTHQEVNEKCSDEQVGNWRQHHPNDDNNANGFKPLEFLEAGYDGVACRRNTTLGTMLTSTLWP
jgi:hypothetical protein